MALATPTDEQVQRIRSIFALNALHGFLHVGETFYTIQVEGTITYHWSGALQVTDRPKMTFEGSDLDNVIEVFRQWSISRMVSTKV